MKNNPSPKDLIATGAQFAYPSSWPRWEVINIQCIQFNYKIGVEIGVNNGENMFSLLDKGNKKLKMYGVDPYKVQPDNTLYESVKTDINCWTPIVQEDGLIMGHDYNWGNVARAVGEIFTEVWIFPDNIWAASKVWLRND